MSLNVQLPVTLVLIIGPSCKSKENKNSFIKAGWEISLSVKQMH